MGAFANLQAALSLNTADFNAKLAAAQEKMKNFSKQASNIGSKISSKGNSLSSWANNAGEAYKNATKELRSHNLGLKDTARIVQGIMVSQVFYGIAQSISSAVSALWDFNVALDYMHVTYSALFGDDKIATDFMGALQEHSIETIFDYQTLADASKKLLAYGIEYENLMFIMEGLTNLGTMSGDSAALDRISLALGQIYSKGKLSAEEMRQLANAYIPITDIIQEKFGLSQDDLKSVGDLNLPASEVINAIVDYANENFGSVGDAAMYTITGLQNRIVDTLKVIGASMLKPITSAYKSFLAYVSAGLEAIREEFNAGGVGAVFEYLVPNKNTQQAIRQFIANVKNLFMSLVSVGTVVGQVFGNIASVFVTAFNIAAPVITGFVNVLSGLLNAMLQNRTGALLLHTALVAAAGAFVLLKVHALASLVITAVTNAVVGLSKALLLLGSIISKHPILSLLAGLAVALVGVSVASNGANAAISGVFDTLSGATGGTSSDEILQRVEQDLLGGANAADQFNNRLSGAMDAANELADATDGVGNAADKAAKKTNGLLSFDEVFKLPESTAAAGGAGDFGIGDSLAGLGDIGNMLSSIGDLSDLLIPDIPDFSEYISDFTDGLFGGLETGIMDKLASTSIGALIAGALGAIIGGIFGGAGGAKLGAKIGMAAGAFVGMLWEALEGAISNTIVGFGAGVFRTLTATLVKAGGATFGEFLKNLIAQGSIKGFFTGLANVLKTTGLKSILKGGLIGTAVGLIVDGIAHLLWNGLAEKFDSANVETAKIGQWIGSLIGTIIGGIFAGPGGAMAGSAIGTFVVGLIGLFWEPIKNFYSGIVSTIDGWFTDLWTTLANKFDSANAETAKVGQKIGAALAAVIGGILAGPMGALIGSAIGTFVGGFVGLFWEPIRDFFVELGTDIGGWIADTFNGLSVWWSDTAGGFEAWATNTLARLSNWWNETTSGFTCWWTNATSGISTWWKNTTKIFSDWDSINRHTLHDWLSDTTKDLTDWATKTYNNFLSWAADTKAGFIDWASGTYTSMSTWYDDTLSKLSAWWTNTKQSFIDWKDSVISSITEWKDNVISNITKWKDTTIAAIKAWASDTWRSIVEWAAETLRKFDNWVADVKTSFSNWKDAVLKIIGGFVIAAIKAIQGWLGDMRTAISNWFTDTKQSIATWWSGLFDTSKWKSGWSIVRQWFTNLFNDIRNWFTSLKGSIGSWWEGLWDGKEVSVNTYNSGYNGRASLIGHYNGGIFGKEHIARFAEGNRAEAVIPLENAGAMKPFVDAVSNGITSSLAPIIAGMSPNSNNQLPPMYVGTLIADERGLRELYKKFTIIQVQENARRGLTPAEVF